MTSHKFQTVVHSAIKWINSTAFFCARRTHPKNILNMPTLPIYTVLGTPKSRRWACVGYPQIHTYGTSPLFSHTVYLFPLSPRSHSKCRFPHRRPLSLHLWIFSLFFPREKRYLVPSLSLLFRSIKPVHSRPLKLYSLLLNRKNVKK